MLKESHVMAFVRDRKAFENFCELCETKGPKGVLLLLRRDTLVGGQCRGGEIGRRTCLRSKREKSHGSSSLPLGTLFLISKRYHLLIVELTF